MAKFVLAAAVVAGLAHAQPQNASCTGTQSFYTDTYQVRVLAHIRII
jgi:hypothetical protein